MMVLTIEDDRVWVARDKRFDVVCCFNQKDPMLLIYSREPRAGCYAEGIAFFNTLPIGMTEVVTCKDFL